MSGILVGTQCIRHVTVHGMNAQSLDYRLLCSNHNVCSFSLSISTVASTSCMPTGYVRNEFLYFMKKNRNNIYLLFIYYMVYTHVKSFTTVKNRKCGQVTSHCRKARPYRAHLSLFLNVPVATIKSEITV